MRTLVTSVLSLVLGASILLAVPDAAQGQPSSPQRVVDVVEVKGLVDQIVVDYLERALDAAEANKSEALILQIDSAGGVVGQSRLRHLLSRLHFGPVPVAAWVGGSGSPRAYGDAFLLVTSARISGVSPGARVGNGRVGPVVGPAYSRSQALANHTVDLDAPTLGDFIVQLDGREVAGHRLDTAEVVQRDGQARRIPKVRARFSKLPLTARLLHGVTSPSIAYLLLMVGLLLFVFELFTAGVGVAGVTGVIAFLLAAHGLAALPTRPWALALVGLGVLGYTIDLQAGAPRTWTVIGTLALAIGSVRLFDGLPVSWPTLALILAATALAMVSGMPAMMRTRFSTPTIGRSSMIGQSGIAKGDVNPDGTVEVDGAPWPARTNRATPIESGEPVKVVAIDGLLLEVEPETGGARDYRH